MKPRLLLALLALLVAPLYAQKAVQKSDATATRDEITGDLKFGTGKTGTFLTGSALTLNSGSTLTLNGALAGTPTGGTLSLAALTLTLPSNFVTLTGTQTLTNKTLTAPSIASISNTGTLTLPTATDTLIGRATTDTLTGKSLALGSNTLTGTSAQLATAISDETGSGALVFGTAPTLGNATLTGNTLVSALTSGRITLAGASGLLADDADLTFATDTLTATKGTFGGITHVSGAITAPTGSALTLTGGDNGAPLLLESGASGAVLSNRSIYVSSLSVPRSSDPGISIFRTMTGAGNGHGFSEQSDFAKAAGTAFGAFDSRFLVSGTANYDHFVSFQAAPTLSTSGTTTNLYGIYTLPGITAGTVTNSYGLYVANPAISGSGAITHSWGIYVPAPTGATNNYAATFMGKVGIGKNPASLLDISGASPRINLADPGTSYAMLKLGNTSGNAYFGRESSAGGAILTGSTAYATVLVGDGATPMQFATDATLRMTLSSTGTLLLGTTTQPASLTGGISIVASGSGATATGVQTGGLQSPNFGLSTVSGGASYFGGTATFAGAVTHTLGTNYPPQTAPASPASGWVLYTDSGDGNKLKAKASTGTVVTIGTP